MVFYDTRLNKKTSNLFHLSQIYVPLSTIYIIKAYKIRRRCAIRRKSNIELDKRYLRMAAVWLKIRIARDARLGH